MQFQGKEKSPTFQPLSQLKDLTFPISGVFITPSLLRGGGGIKPHGTKKKKKIFFIKEKIKEKIKKKKKKYYQEINFYV